MSRAGRPDPASQLEGEIRELASFDAGEFQVVSVMLDTDGRRYPGKRELELQLAELVRRARAEADGLELPRAAEQALNEDLARIVEFVSGGFERGGTRGLAFFACKGAKSWRVFRLPRSLRSRFAVHMLRQFVRHEILLHRSEAW